MPHNIGNNYRDDSVHPYSSHAISIDNHRSCYHGAPQHDMRQNFGCSGAGSNTSASLGLPEACLADDHHHHEPYRHSPVFKHESTSSLTRTRRLTYDVACIHSSNVVHRNRISSPTSTRVGMEAWMPSAVTAHDPLTSLDLCGEDFGSISAYQQDPLQQGAPPYNGFETGERRAQTYCGTKEGALANPASCSDVDLEGHLRTKSPPEIVINCSNFPGQLSSQSQGSQSFRSPAGGQDTGPIYFHQLEFKRRRRTTKVQHQVLEAAFAENAKPAPSTRKQLSEKLGMTLRAVQVWFQNRRAKAKAVAKKEAAGQTKSAGSSMSSTKDADKEETLRQRRDQPKSERSQQNLFVNTTTESLFTPEQDGRCQNSSKTDGLDWFFNTPSCLLPSQGSVIHKSATPAALSQLLNDFGTSSGVSTSSTCLACNGLFSSERATPKGDDHYILRAMTAPSDSLPAAYKIPDNSFSNPLPASATNGVSIASSFIASQHGSDQQQDFCSGFDANRRFSCPGEVLSTAPDMDHTTPTSPYTFFGPSSSQS